MGKVFKFFTLLLTCVFISLSASADIKVSVGDMTCESCANTIKKGFAKVSEIESCEVDVDGGLVTLKVKAKKEITDEKIKSTIEHYGYTVKGIKRDS